MINWLKGYYVIIKCVSEISKQSCGTNFGTRCSRQMTLIYVDKPPLSQTSYMAQNLPPVCTLVAQTHERPNYLPDNYNFRIIRGLCPVGRSAGHAKKEGCMVYKCIERSLNVEFGQHNILFDSVPPKAVYLMG